MSAKVKPSHFNHHTDASSKPLKLVFAGTPDFAADILKAILAKGHSVSAVYCQPDRRVGRGKKISFGAVKSLALSQNIPVEQPVRFDGRLDGGAQKRLQEQRVRSANTLASYQPDLMIVVAYGLILPESILSLPKFGCVNIHASLLPKWRGAAPIQRAIESGDKQTGISIMQMNKGLDTGNLLLTKPCSILPLDTASSLHDRLAELGGATINEFLNSFYTIASNTGINDQGSFLAPGKAQVDQNATYAHKLSKAEGEIDWKESAASIERKIRAFNPWPVCFTYVGSKRLRLWQAQLDDSQRQAPTKSVRSGQIIGLDKKGIAVQCGDGQALLLTHLQADGSRAMSVAEMINAKKQWFVDHPVLGTSLSASFCRASTLGSPTPTSGTSGTSQ